MGGRDDKRETGLGREKSQVHFWTCRGEECHQEQCLADSVIPQSGTELQEVLVDGVRGSPMTDGSPAEQKPEERSWEVARGGRVEGQDGAEEGNQRRKGVRGVTQSLEDSEPPIGGCGQPPVFKPKSLYLCVALATPPVNLGSVSASGEGWSHIVVGREQLCLSDLSALPGPKETGNVRISIQCLSQGMWAWRQPGGKVGHSEGWFS